MNLPFAGQQVSRVWQRRTIRDPNLDACLAQDERRDRSLVAGSITVSQKMCLRVGSLGGATKRDTQRSSGCMDQLLNFRLVLPDIGFKQFGAKGFQRPAYLPVTQIIASARRTDPPPQSEHAPEDCVGIKNTVSG
jgi:hypothetical protein